MNKMQAEKMIVVQLSHSVLSSKADAKAQAKAHAHPAD